MYRLWKHWILLAGLLFLLLPGSAYAADTNAAGEAVFPEGLYIGSESIGGRTEEEVRTYLQEKTENVSSTVVVVDWQGKKIQTTLKKLGMTIGIDEVIEKAWSACRNGGVITQYKDLMDLKYGNLHLEYCVRLSEQALERFVIDDVASECDIAPVNASLKYSSGSRDGNPGKERDSDGSGRHDAAIRVAVESADLHRAPRSVWDVPCRQPGSLPTRGKLSPRLRTSWAVILPSILPVHLTGRPTSKLRQIISGAGS